MARRSTLGTQQHATARQARNGTVAPGSIIDRLDSVVDDFARRTRYFNEPITRGRATMFAMQHRLNSRHRNSVLKLDRKSTRLNSSHIQKSRMPSSA